MLDEQNMETNWAAMREHFDNTATEFLGLVNRKQNDWSDSSDDIKKLLDVKHHLYKRLHKLPKV